MENPLNPNPSLGLDATSYQDLLKLTAKQYELFISAKKQYVLTDFWEFSKEVIGWKDLYEPLHKPMCDFAQDNRGKKRLMLVPRGHLKSSVITVGYSLWRIAQNPKIRILIANATNPLAITFLKQIKDHLSKNERFKELFGDLATGAQTWAEETITINRPDSWDAKEATVTVYGIGGSLTSQHYDLILLDDIVNRENIHTSDRIEDVKTFYKDVMDLRDNVQTSEVMIIGTRWHEADLYGWLMDEDNPARHEFEVFERTAVSGDYQIVKDTSGGGYKIEGGDILFPTKFTREGLEKLINDKGLSEFSSQYMNDPVPSEQATFKHEFQYYMTEDIKGMEILRYIACDPAFFDPTSRNPDLDYAVFIVVDVNSGNDWYIRDIIRERMQPNEILVTMFDLDTKWKPKTFGIESTAFQKILSYSAKEMMRERNHFIPITELKHAGANAKSKIERIQALEPRYAIGSIKHNKNVRHIATLEMELRRFPRGKTDDCADCLANMLEIARPPKKTGERSSGYVPIYPA
jgi:predicted phage terminase large subunit-like protein